MPKVLHARKGLRGGRPAVVNYIGPSISDFWPQYRSPMLDALDRASSVELNPGPYGRRAAWLVEIHAIRAAEQQRAKLARFQLLARAFDAWGECG